MKRLSVYLFLALCAHGGFAQQQNAAYLQYIEKYHTVAQQQQHQHGIPASITLAQGLLESGAGQSTLTREANNHFGIKCHGWTGEGYVQDDDRPNECFRKYRSAADSYEDHSAFLVSGKRYANLFDLSPTDYEQWAHGLKNAGYATDPSYAYKLISIIETYELHRFDLKKNAQPRYDAKTQKNLYTAPQKVAFENFSMGSISPDGEHETYLCNGVKYVVAQKGDSFVGIADEFGIKPGKILDYNDADSDAVLQAGERVYLARKKRRAAQGTEFYTVREGDSMFDISQKFAIRLQALYDLNSINYSEGAKLGETLRLR